MIALENKAEVLLVQLVPVFLLEPVDRMIEEVILAGPVAVVHANQVQQRGFSGAGGAHDGHEFALLDVDIDSAKHERFGRSMFKILLNVAETDHMR